MADAANSNASEEYKRVLQREITKLTKQITCHKCKAKRVETLYLPCRHVVACESCSEKAKNCIECGLEILGTARTYIM